VNIRSYLGKLFVVESSNSVIRDENFVSQKYQAGDHLPPGKAVGDVKIIPQRTEIVVTDVKVNPGRHVFVFARPASDPAGEFGWTSAANFVGSFANETFGFAPAIWQLEPDGNNRTVIDAKAFIREGPPSFASTANVIPSGSFVTVTETSEDKQNVKVSKLDIINGQPVVGDEIGWTRANNLIDGCSDVFFKPEWKDQKGPNACWDKGSFIGAKILVNIVGFGGEMEQVTLDSLAPYLKLSEAASDDANLSISINSAFRTFQRQAQLRRLFELGQGNLAAKAGSSNHQHGQAFDLNTRHNVFNGTDKIYEWLKKNAPKHGFIRSVSNESWHWEYRPAQAAQLGPDKFRLPGVEP
jgi:hypothetical protein